MKNGPCLVSPAKLLPISRIPLGPHPTVHATPLGRGQPQLIMDRIRQLSEIPSMPRYSAGNVNIAELEAAVHVAPTSTNKGGGKGNGNDRRLSNTSRNRISSNASINTDNASVSDESTSGVHVAVLCTCVVLQV